ncbi:hypothetical protein Tco_0202196, partial [Tanacetum coccineum]
WFDRRLKSFRLLLFPLIDAGILPVSPFSESSIFTKLLEFNTDTDQVLLTAAVCESRSTETDLVIPKDCCTKDLGDPDSEKGYVLAMVKFAEKGVWDSMQDRV